MPSSSLDDNEADIAIVQNDVMHYAANGSDLFKDDGKITSFKAAAGLEGYMMSKISIIKRIFIISGGLMLIYPGYITDILGILIVGFIFLSEYLKVLKLPKAFSLKANRR